MLAVPFVYFFYCFSSRAPKNQKNIWKWLLSLSWPIYWQLLLFLPCLTTNLLSFSSLKQPQIILSAYPLEQRAFDSHYIESGCLYSQWQKKQSSSRILASGGSLPVAVGASVWLLEQIAPVLPCLIPILLDIVLWFHFYYISTFDCPEELQCFIFL